MRVTAHFSLSLNKAEAFGEWITLVAQAIDNWRPQQARPLLILMRQLVEEGEPFLSKTSEPYGYYLLWYAQLLEQEVHWQQAQAVLEEAAKLFEQMSNPADFSTALNNLARLYHAQGQYAEAEPLYQRALAIREQQVGPQHPDTATSLNNLAGLYRTQGQYAQAEPLYQRALAIREQQLGPEHPDTVTVREIYHALVRSMKRKGK